MFGNAHINAALHQEEKMSRKMLYTSALLLSYFTIAHAQADDKDPSLGISCFGNPNKSRLFS